MDKIFEQVIKQHSVLCTIPIDILKIISNFLPPSDLVHLSHTCKEIHSKLPFYLIRSGDFWLTGFNKVNFSKVWFYGSAINFSISEINITLHFYTGSVFPVWMEIIRSGKVYLKTQELWSRKTKQTFQFTRNSSVLREYKPGDRYRFKVGMAYGLKPVYDVDCFGFQVSVKLENYKYDEPIINVTKKVKEFEEFKKPASIKDLNEGHLPPLPCLCSYSVAGDTFFRLCSFKYYG